ncbi:MAG: ATP-binding protein [Bacilli bacterium]|nr:ATP-binding protein [Bacilli bacterium]
MRMISRNTFLQKLIDRKNNGLIKVITGIRRCGKSYLLFEIFYNYLISSGVNEDHIIKIELDDRMNINLRDPDYLFSYVREKITDKDMYYLLLDEVQYVNEFEDVLNSFLHIKNIDVYVTGSNAKFLSKDIITEFRGRGDQIYLCPLTFKEFYDAYGKEFDDAWNEYSVFGGLPYLLSCKTEEQKVLYLKNLFEETYINDILNRNSLRGGDSVEELLNIVASSVGSLTNPSKLSKAFKSTKNAIVAPNTIKEYLDYFVDSFLISKAFRYDVKGKNYIDTPLKYYFTDIGLRNVRLGFRQQEENHIMENVIYNELISRGYNVDVGIVEISEKNENGNYVRKQLEVDFVCNLGYDRIYIQSALNVDTEEKMIQERKSLIKIDDSFKKIVIVRNNIKKWKDDNGILFVGLKEFLLDSNIING